MKTTLARTFILGLTITAAVVLGGCSKREPTDAYRIPVILPLTGQAAVLGEFNKNAMDIAAEQANSRLQPDGHKVEIVYGDSMNDPKEGLSLFLRYSSVDRAPVVVCAMSSVTNALIAPAEERSTVLMATTVSAAGITDGHERLFRLFIRADIDARTMAEFAARKLNYRRVAVVYVQDDMGASFRDVFKEHFEANGGKIVAEEGFDRAALDFRPMLTRLKGKEFDAIYLLAYEKTMGLIPKQMAELNIKTTLLSIATIGEPYVIEQAGASIDGAYFTSVEFDPDNPRSEEARQFVEQYVKRFGKKPNYFSAFAYDTIGVLVAAMEKGGYSADGIAKGLRGLHDFQGVTGKITFKVGPDASFPMYVRRIQNGKIVDAEEKP